MYYGELSNQLMVRIPTSTDASTFDDGISPLAVKPKPVVAPLP
jgi:hypothetical protein